MGAGGRESAGFFQAGLLSGGSCVDARRRHAASVRQRVATRHLVVVGHRSVLSLGTLMKLTGSKRASRA